MFRGYEFSFYATREDLIGSLQRIETSNSIKYIQSGSFDEGDLSIYEAAESIPGFGMASSPDSISQASYLVRRSDADVAVEEVVTTEGTVRYVISQRQNLESVEITPAGLYLGAPKVWSDAVSRCEAIIEGRVVTLHSDVKESRNLFNLLKRTLRKDFINVGGYWIGQEALLLHKAKYRLTQDARNRLYDLDLRNPVG